MNIRKLFPWLPVIGIPLVMYYHPKYGDTGIEDWGIVMFGSALFQVVSLAIVISKVLL